VKVASFVGCAWPPKLSGWQRPFSNRKITVSLFIPIHRAILQFVVWNAMSACVCIVCPLLCCTETVRFSWGSVCWKQVVNSKTNFRRASAYESTTSQHSFPYVPGFLVGLISAAETLNCAICVCVSLINLLLWDTIAECDVCAVLVSVSHLLVIFVSSVRQSTNISRLLTLWWPCSDKDCYGKMGQNRCSKEKNEKECDISIVLLFYAPCFEKKHPIWFLITTLTNDRGCGQDDVTLEILGNEW